MQDISLLRPFWKKLFASAWIAAIVMFVLLAVPRVMGMWGPVSLRWLGMSGFFIMWFLPLLLFTKRARKMAGFQQPKKPVWLIYALLLGFLFAIVCFLIGMVLYARSDDHWFVSVLHSYAIDDGMRNWPFWKLYAVYTLPAVIFSPIGEEFFFRGIIQKSFEVKWGFKVGLFVNATAFSLIHLFHHGIVYVYADAAFVIKPLSGFIWFLLMFGASCIFTWCMRKGGSVWLAVLAHAGFNMGMNVVIFRYLL